MPLIESITEANHTGKARTQQQVKLLNQNTNVFKNVIEGMKAAGTEETVNAKATTLDDLFRKAANTYGISEQILKAVAKQESGFKTTAVSKAGAMGIMQLMPSTAKSLGVSDPFNAEQNIMGGAKLLAKNLKDFGGDLKLALAAYNAGAGNVKKYNGIPPFSETQNYVKNIMADLGDNAKIDIHSILNRSGTGSASQDLLGIGSSIHDVQSMLQSFGLGHGLNNGSLNMTSILSLLTSSKEDTTSNGSNKVTVDKDMFANLIEILRLQMMMNAGSSIGDFDTHET